MRFSTNLGLAAASLVSAALAGGETIIIKDLTIHKQKVNHADKESIIDAASFKLSGWDAAELFCAVRNPDYPEPIRRTTCGKSKYQFELHPGKHGSDYGVRIYHGEEYGFSDVPTSCKKGRGPLEIMCLQEAPPVHIVIQ